MSSLRRVLFVSGSRAAGTLRYRVRLAQEALASRGVASHACYYRSSAAAAFLPDADVLVLYRCPATDWVAHLVADAHRRGIPVSYDIDDLVFTDEHLNDAQLSASLTEFEKSELAGRSTAASWAQYGSASTDVIRDELATLTAGHATVIPNGVSRVALAAVRDLPPRQPGVGVTLGYFSGSATHDADWQTIEADVADCLSANPTTRLLLVGEVRTGSRLAAVDRQVHRLPRQDWRDLYGLLAETDINLVPLTGTRFTTGKSAIKWLEAALVGTATIATATQPHQQAIRQGTTGLLVPPGASWLPVLDLLASDPAQRQGLGRAAKESALAVYGPEQQAQRYVDYFTMVCALKPESTPAPGPFRVPPWPDRLEPYPFTSPLPRWRAPIWRQASVRARRILQPPARLRRT